MTKTTTCPKCGKRLLRYENEHNKYTPGIYKFWCDDCDINVEFVDNKEYEEYLRTRTEITQCLRADITFIDQVLDAAEIKRRLDADDVIVRRNKIFEFCRDA